MLRALTLTIRSVRTRGPVATLGILLTTIMDVFYDWRRGTRTFGWTSLDAYSIASPNRERGRAYQATSAFAFDRLLKKVDIPRDAGFVDFGCGKGRVLLLAADAGFEHIVGIEFASELVAEARRNVERWQTARRGAANIQVIEGDVLNYRIEQADRVFFFFNPFDDVIFDRVLDRIEASLEAAPRPAWIVYHNPLESSRIDARPRFHKIASHSFLGNEFAVYHSLA